MVQVFNFMFSFLYLFFFWFLVFVLFCFVFVKPSQHIVLVPEFGLVYEFSVLNFVRKLNDRVRFTMEKKNCHATSVVPEEKHERTG